MTATKKIVLAIDIQREYVTEGRPFHIAGIDSSLPNVRKVIDGARDAGVPVWHVQHVQDGAIFDRNTEYIDFVGGFEPLEGEPTFQKDMYSAFSTPALAQAVTEAEPEEIVVIGYGTSLCCISTIIDGLHRGHSFTLVEDATGAKNANGVSEDDMHQSAVNVLRQFAKIKSTDEVVAELAD
jgi:ureidoacrylate peracid hydrolase